jgi:hypothetical protein
MAIGSLPLIPKYFVSVLIERDKNVTNEKAPARMEPGLSLFISSFGGAVWERRATPNQDEGLARRQMSPAHT